MSHHFDLQKADTLQDPITFTLDGEKTYTIVNITDDLLEEIDDIAGDDDLTPGEVLSQKLATYADCEAADFDALEFREKLAILQHIAESMASPLGNRKQRRGRKR